MSDLGIIAFGKVSKLEKRVTEVEKALGNIASTLEKLIKAVKTDVIQESTHIHPSATQEGTGNSHTTLAGQS